MSAGEHQLANRYELGRVLGRGGMAQVYDGHDRLLERRVAVKVLHPVYAADHEFLARFRREARAAGSLSHPGIVRIYDTGQDGDAHYIVMEYVEGRTLAQMLAAGGALPPERAAAIAEDVCEALAVAHGQGLIHRDVKPGNVMLTAAGEVKVMDFGIARAIEGATVITTAMSVMGTPRYMSPEQVEGEPLDARSDLYSLGICLYELLSGRVPFTGPTPIAVATQHVSAAPPPLRDLAPRVPAGLIAVTERALAKDPAQRPQSATAFAAELAATRTGRDPAAGTPPPHGERRVRLIPVAVSGAATGTTAEPGTVTGTGAGTATGARTMIAGAGTATGAGTVIAGAGTATGAGTVIAGAGTAIAGADEGVTSDAASAADPAMVDRGSGGAATSPDSAAAPGSAAAGATVPEPIAGPGDARAASVPGRVGEGDGDGPSGEYQFGADYRLGPEYVRPAPNFGGPDDAERRRRTRVVAVLLGIVALLTIAGFALARGEDAAPSGGEEQPSDGAAVPQVDGQPVEEARTVLAEAGFAVAERRVASDTVAAGEVIGLDPEAGTAQEPGDTVGLLVSSGPATPGRGPAPAPGGAGPVPVPDPSPAPTTEQPAPTETAQPPAPSPSPTATTTTEPTPSPTASAEPSPTVSPSDPPTPDPTETATNPAPPAPPAPAPT